MGSSPLRLVDALVPEAAVEALDEAVLHGLDGSDVVPVDLPVLGPSQDRHAVDLGAVGSKRVEPAVVSKQVVQLLEG